MPWEVTLQIVDCGNMAHKLAGAGVYSTALDPNLGYADANGEYIVADPYDLYSAIFVQISYSGYLNKTFSCNAVQNGTIQTVCLTVSPPTTPGSGGGSSGGVSCMIVTAATGSAESEEVVCLRQLRDRVSAISQLGRKLIDVIYDEYYQFSPDIAAELDQDPLACQAALWGIVRPLLAWYKLAGAMAFESLDRDAAARATKDLADACPVSFGPMVLSTFEAIRAGRPLLDDSPQLLLKFESRLRRAAELRFASWAILDPLIRAWRSADGDIDPIDEVAEWLATAPIETISPTVCSDQLDAELRALAGFFDFRPAARLQLGQRLISGWPNVCGALRRAGFVE